MPKFTCENSPNYILSSGFSIKSKQNQIDQHKIAITNKPMKKLKNPK